VARLSQLTDALADLPEGEKGYLAQTRRARELAEAIVRQQLRVDATNRPYFREIETRSLAQKYNRLPAEAGYGGVCLAPVRAVVFFHQRFREWPGRGD
jgi:hypothetical protein